MTTFNTDFCRIQFTGGTRDLTCKQLGIDWPPPEYLEIHGFKFRLFNYSKLTDADLEQITLIARGAVYVPVSRYD